MPTTDQKLEGQSPQTVMKMMAVVYWRKDPNEVHEGL